MKKSTVFARLYIDGPEREGTFPLFIQVGMDDDILLFPTGIWLRPDSWDAETDLVNDSVEGAEAQNERIQSTIVSCKKALMGLKKVKKADRLLELANVLELNSGWDYSLVHRVESDWKWFYDQPWAADGQVSITLHADGLHYTLVDVNPNHGSSGYVTFVQPWDNFFEIGGLYGLRDHKKGQEGIPAEIFEEVGAFVKDFRMSFEGGRKLKIGHGHKITAWDLRTISLWLNGRRVFWLSRVRRTGIVFYKGAIPDAMEKGEVQVGFRSKRKNRENTYDYLNSSFEFSLSRDQDLSMDLRTEIKDGEIQIRDVSQ